MLLSQAEKSVKNFNEYAIIMKDAEHGYTAAFTRDCVTYQIQNDEANVYAVYYNGEEITVSEFKNTFSRRFR